MCVVRWEKLDPGKATETALDRTNGDGERLPQRRTARKQRQPNAFTNFTVVPSSPRELAREPTTENRKKYTSKSLIQRFGEMLGSLECLGASSRLTTTCRERFERPIYPNATDVTPVIPNAVGDPSQAGDAASTKQRHATQPDTSKHVHQAVGIKRGAEANPMFSSAKRAHAIHRLVPQILSQLRVEMEMMSVSEGAMKAQPDVEIGTESVQRGTKRTSSTWEDCVDKTNMEVCLDATGTCRRCDADEVLDATVAKCSSGVADTKGHPWRTVISTRMSHEAKRNKAQPRTVIPECADAVRVSEHYASTPCTRTQRLTINRMLSKCRTRQPESCDTSPAFLHDWSHGGSARWSSGSAHMMTDVSLTSRVRRQSCRQLQKPRCPA